MAAATYRKLVYVSLFFVTAIIVTGASVRLSGSGLGCPTWPKCTNDQMIDVSDPHRATEQINRLFTGAVGFAVIGAFAGAFRRRPYRRDLAWFGALLIGGVLLQGVIGGAVVLLELQWQSVALHFLASFLLLYGNLELLRRADEPDGARVLSVSARVRTLTEIVFGLTILVLVFGTLVTGAGPHGGDADVERLDWPIDNAVRLHSLTVWALIAAVIGLIAVARRDGAAATLARAEAVLAIGLVQGAIGYIQWFNKVPPVLVGIHVLGAASTFIAVSWLRFASHRVPSPARSPEPIAVETLTS